MKKTTFILVCLAAMFSTSAFAQDSREVAQAKLTQAFQGKSVSLKVDMPATDKGSISPRARPNRLRREVMKRGSRITGPPSKTARTR